MTCLNFPNRVIFYLFVTTILVALATAPSRAQDVITTVAGSTWVPRGGEAATNASLGRVQGVEVDPLGNVFVADPDSHLVLKISPQGVLSVVAGNGVNAFGGDGGPATAASLVAP